MENHSDSNLNWDFFECNQTAHWWFHLQPIYFKSVGPLLTHTAAHMRQVHSSTLYPNIATIDRWSTFSNNAMSNELLTKVITSTHQSYNIKPNPSVNVSTPAMSKMLRTQIYKIDFNVGNTLLWSPACYQKLRSRVNARNPYFDQVAGINIFIQAS